MTVTVAFSLPANAASKNKSAASKQEKECSDEPFPLLYYPFV
jgi:hypothetical protein